MLETHHAESNTLPSAVPSVVDRHAEEVATRWWRRATAYLDSPSTPFEDLFAFDETIDAHLDGLVESGEYAVTLFERAVKSSAPDVGADVFAALMFAFASGNAAWMARIDACTEGLDSKPAALEGVFAWDDGPAVEHAVRHYLRHDNLRYREAALAQSYVHRINVDHDLQPLLADAASPLLARALRTAGECGCINLLPSITRWLESPATTPPQVRYWAAWSSVVLGARSDTAIALLQQEVAQGGDLTARSLCLLCLALPSDALLPYLHSLGKTSLRRQLLIQALGWSGAPEYLPWLIDQMQGGPDARVAGQAFRLITGIDFELDGATLSEPDDLEEEDAPDSPLPDADYVRAWWHTHAHEFNGHGRFLLGSPITLASLDTILASGEQSHRELAALHRALQRPGHRLIPTHAQAAIQWLRQEQLKEEDNDSH